LPQSVLPALTVTCPGQNANPGVELINVITPSYVSVVAHLKGNIICYHNPTDDAWNGFAFPIKPLPNGNMLASVTNIYTDNPNPQCVVREVDLAGNTVTDGNGLRELDLATLNNYLLQLKTPKDTVVQTTYYHHDVLPLPNGHLILVVQQRMTVNGADVWGMRWWIWTSLINRCGSGRPSITWMSSAIPGFA